MSKDPKSITFYGRLSYPTFTAQEAYDQSLRGQFPAKDVASVSPAVQLLVTQGQFDKVMNHFINEFLPYCQRQHDAGEKRDALEAAEVKKLIASITGDLADQTYNSPVKLVSDKTAALAPEAVAAMKVIGPKGGDFTLKAIVTDESELAVPDPDLISFPTIVPVNNSVHQFYPGCVVAVTAQPYAYHNGRLAGFSLGADTLVFRTDADRFGGGVSIDTDEIFMD
jgi:hypothetical protein